MPIVLFATSWGPKHGGINAFNRDFAIGLSQNNHNQESVYCIVLSASPEEERDAQNNGVNIISLEKLETSKTFDPDWVVSVEEKFEGLGLTIQNTVWVGHDVISGEIAGRAAQKFDGKSAIIHHMRYEYYDVFKDNGYDKSDNKSRKQEEIFRKYDYDYFFSVGPLLKDSCEEITSKSCVMLVPGFSPNASTREKNVSRINALTFGRMDPSIDRIKQGSLAAVGFGRAISSAYQNSGSPSVLKNNPKLTVLGFSKEDDTTSLEALVREEADRAVNLSLLSFDSDRKSLFNRLEGMNLSLMLSLHEGFGLTGWEAISFEIPLIISKQSGLYKLIDEGLSGQGNSYVQAVDIKGPIDKKTYHSDDIETISNAYLEAAANIRKRKTEAQKLKQLFCEKYNGCTWENTASQFLDTVFNKKKEMSQNPKKKFEIKSNRIKKHFSTDDLQKNINIRITEQQISKRILKKEKKIWVKHSYRMGENGFIASIMGQMEVPLDLSLIHI